MGLKLRFQVLMDGQRWTSSTGTAGEKPGHIQEKAREACQRKTVIKSRANLRAQRPSSNFGSADVVSLGSHLRAASLEFHVQKPPTLSWRMRSRNKGEAFESDSTNTHTHLGASRPDQQSKWGLLPRKYLILRKALESTWMPMHASKTTVP